MQVNRADLRLRAKRRADLEGSNFVSDEEWNDYLREGAAELHGIIVDLNEDYLLKSKEISLTANTDSYVLPDDFLKLRGVDLLETSGGNIKYTLLEYSFRDRNQYQIISQFVDWGEGFRYHVEGNAIKFTPVPSGSDTVNLHYIQDAPELENDKSTLPLVYGRQWERYVVIYAAMEAKSKQDAPVDNLARKLERARKLITRAANKRNFAEPKKAVDVRYTTNHTFLRR